MHRALPLWYDRSGGSTRYNTKQIVPATNNAASMLLYQLFQWNGHLFLHCARLIDMTRYVVQLHIIIIILIYYYKQI